MSGTVFAGAFPLGSVVADGTAGSGASTAADRAGSASPEGSTRGLDGRPTVAPEGTGDTEACVDEEDAPADVRMLARHAPTTTTRAATAINGKTTRSARDLESDRVPSVLLRPIVDARWVEAIASLDECASPSRASREPDGKAGFEPVDWLRSTEGRGARKEKLDVVPEDTRAAVWSA
jgi:hypothetical protein